MLRVASFVFPDLRNKGVAGGVEQVDRNFFRILALHSGDQVVEGRVKERSRMLWKRGVLGQRYTGSIPVVYEVSLKEVDESG